MKYLLLLLCFIVASNAFPATEENEAELSADQEELFSDTSAHFNISWNAEYEEAWENALNKTEDATKKRKLAILTALFNAKREIIRTLSNVTEAKSQLFQNAIQQIENATSIIQNGLVLSKEMAVNVTGGFTLDNLNSTWQNTQNATLGAIQEAKQGVQQAGMFLMKSLVGVKEALFNFLNNFNSQSVLQNGGANITFMFNATFEGAEHYGAQLGIFQALDNVIHSIAQIPKKINHFLARFLGGKTSENKRPKRDISMEEIDAKLKEESKFWNDLSEKLEQHQLRFDGMVLQ